MLSSAIHAYLFICIYVFSTVCTHMYTLYVHIYYEFKINTFKPIHAYSSTHVMLPKNKQNIFIWHVLSLCLFKKVLFVTSDIFVYSATIFMILILRA